MAQTDGAVEYTGCSSTAGKDLPDECPDYDTKQSDDEVTVMVEVWGMWSTPLLPSLPGPFWAGVVAPGLNRTNLCTYAKLNYLKYYCFDI